MTENIKYRIDKIESDMKYLRYLHISAKKSTESKIPCRPEKKARVDMPCTKPKPARQRSSLSNYIQVSRPAYGESAWSRGSSALTDCCDDFDAYVDPPGCGAPCGPPCLPRPYIEPPCVQTFRPTGREYPRKPVPTPVKVLPCAQGCAAQCNEPRRKPAPTAAELPCVQLCAAQCNEHRRRPVAPPPVEVPCPQACRPQCNDNVRRPVVATTRERKVPLVDGCSRRPFTFKVPETEVIRKYAHVCADDDATCISTCNKKVCGSGVKHTEKVQSSGRSPSKGIASTMETKASKSNAANATVTSVEFEAAEKKLREQEDRLRDSDEKLRVAEESRREAEEKRKASEEALREAERLNARSAEQLRTLQQSLSDAEVKLRAAERDNEKLRINLEASKTASRRNSEAQSMALDLATKIADKYKTASAEKVEALNQIDELKAEGDALLKRLKAAEQKAALLEKQAEKPHVDCQALLDKQAGERERMERALRDMEARALAAEKASADVEELKRAAASSMQRAAEAEERAEAERRRAEEEALRAHQLEEESRVADERANEAENEAREARQRAKEAEQRADDIEAASDDPKKSRDASPAHGEKKKAKCKCRARSAAKMRELAEERRRLRQQQKENSPKRHKCCLCCCKKAYEAQRAREYPAVYNIR